jgi:predicted dienelactone hydrolase
MLRNLVLIYVICFATNVWGLPQQSTQKLAKTLELTVTEPKNKRTIPILLYLPHTTTPAPLILFSHGLGGSRYGGKYLGEYWSRHGYIVAHMQHIGSDNSLWEDKNKLMRYLSLKRAANKENFVNRIEDVHAVINQLLLWNKDKTHPLAGKINHEAIGMSGHSFGGATTQAVSGQTFPTIGQNYTDKRIKAALVLSPSIRGNLNLKDAFDNVSIPWLLMTGTEDDAPIGKMSPKDRLKVYAGLPMGHAYQLVLFAAQHSAFGDIKTTLKRNEPPKNPNHHKVILQLSTAFWDAYLKGDSQQMAWLKSNAPKKIMEEKDTWEYK